jgi:hypothetical protein
MDFNRVIPYAANLSNFNGVETAEMFNLTTDPSGRAAAARSGGAILVYLAALPAQTAVPTCRQSDD